MSPMAITRSAEELFTVGIMLSIPSTKFWELEIVFKEYLSFFSNCIFSIDDKFLRTCVHRKKYETDITYEQWKVIAPLFVNMRKRKWEKRELVNAVLYLVKTGCQWRILLCTAFID
ncbi:MAG: transposase, partial [Selenomonadaceae bacterium]|nr:transposase [Selenomonadaceae bacterium]